MTEKELTALVEGIAPVLKEYVGRELAARDAEIVALKGHLLALDGRVAVVETKGIEYRGIYEPGQTYRRGDQVTRSSSTWVYILDRPSTAGPPGVDFMAWRLAAKGGRGDRDAPPPVTP